MKYIKSNWTVKLTGKVNKQLQNLPAVIRKKISTLVMDIERHGPVRGNWPNYSKLQNDAHHCHVKKGRPTYVVCWRVVNKVIQIVEVYYAGTHEKAPY